MILPPVVRNAFEKVQSVANTLATWAKAHHRPLLIVVAGVAVVVGGVYAFLPAPSAQGALKGRRVEIHRNADIRVIFDQRMDTRSVERTWKLIPGVPGTFRWEGNVVFFTPAVPLEKGQEYELEISDDARNTYGKRLKDVFHQTFAVLDYPEASAVIPSHNTVVRSDQIVTVLFDHPVRALSLDAVPPEILQISPPITGALHWLGTSGFELVPTGDLPAATTFMALVPKGTKMADGSVTIEDKTWSFSTAPVQVSINAPRKLQPDDVIRLEFNYPVSPQAVREAIQLTMKGPNGVESVDRNTLRVARDVDNPNTLTLRPASGFTLGKTYEVKMPQGFTGGVGPNGLPTDRIATLSTYEPDIRITSETSLSTPNQFYVYSGGTAFTIPLNNPLSEEIPASWVTVTPAVENLEIETYSDEWGGRGGEMSLNGLWKPSTTYTVTLRAAFADRFGHRLGKDTVIPVQTYPYRPSVTLSTYAREGVMASHLQRLYQVRALNVSGEWNATLCSISVEEYAGSRGSSCGMKVETTFKVDGELDRYAITDLDLDAMAGRSLPNGFYQLKTSPPTDDLHDAEKRRVSGWETHTREVAIIDTALSLKQDNTGTVLVWATDLKTGEPVASLDVDVYRIAYPGGGTASVEHVKTGKTDKNGVAVIETGETRDRATLMAVAKNSGGRLGVGNTRWDEGISPWSYGLEVNWENRSDVITGYVYTDRRIYRSDHTVQFKGVLRDDRDAAYTIPQERTADVVITDARGGEVKKEQLGLSAYGTFWGSLTLTPDMPLGPYTICATLRADQRPVCGSFDVREYRRPDFQVTVAPPAGSRIAGGDMEVRINAEYYHGAPVAGATARYSVTRTRTYFSPASLWREWFNFSADEGRSWCYWYCRASDNTENVVSGEAVLDNQGNAVIRVPTGGTDGTAGMDYTVNVTVDDLNARSVSGSETFRVHPGDRYVGIRANYESGWDSPNADFDLVVVNAEDGALQANVPVNVTLSRRVWQSVQTRGTDGVTHWESTFQDTPVATQQVTTGADGRAFVGFGAQPDGLYVARAEARDTAGRTVAASSERYMYRSWYDMDGMGVTDDRHMKILQSKAEYEPGETAVLAVQSPYENVKALVTVERDAIRSHRVVTLDATHRTVDIPLADADIPNVYVSVLAVQGGGEKEIPDFKLGYAQLQVGTTRKALDLSLTADRTEYRPGDTATLTLRANTSDGRPAQAEISVAVVDERVVDLLGPIDKNILGKFYFPRTIGVFTSQSLTALVKKVFFDTPEGGDGKGGDSASAVRGNFLDTAYWKADVITGPDGTATVQVPLPDNLTTWQVLAIGATKDTVVGSAETSFKTRRTLMAEPLLPRILRQGDRVSVGATIHNSTPAPLAVRVTIDAPGIEVSGGERTITIPANGRLPVSWDVRIPEQGAPASVAFTVRAFAEGLEDGFVVDVPVLAATTPDILGTSGILQQTVTETIQIPEDASTDRGEMRVTVTPSLGEGLEGGIDYLLNYHYGCTEQTTSALLAGLAYAELVKHRLATGSPEGQARAEEKVRGGIAALRNLQAENGGLGFWSSSDRVYPHLTAYAFWGVTRAEQAGFDVDQDFLNRMDSYLRDYLQNPNAFQDARWSYGHLNDDERSQVLYALSLRNTNGLMGFAETLYERRESLSTFGKAFLALSYINIQNGSSSARAATLMDEVQNRIIVQDRFGAYVDDGSGYSYFMSSRTRSTAIVLMAYLRLKPNDQMTDRLMRYLLTQRRDGYWESTQATSLSLLALTEYAKAHPVDDGRRVMELFLDGKRGESLVFDQGDHSPAQSRVFDMPQLTASGFTHEVGMEQGEDRRAFYDITLKAYRPFGATEPVESGFTVLSSLHALDDAKNAAPLTSVRQGQNIRIHLKILVPKKHEYVAVESHLPAGLEAVDFTLNTSPKEIAGEQKTCSPGWGGGTRCYEDWELDYWWGNVWTHREYRDDRVFLFAEHLEPGVYEYDVVAQATTAGRFHMPSAQVFEFYHPEVRGTSQEQVFTVVRP